MKRFFGWMVLTLGFFSPVVPAEDVVELADLLGQRHTPLQVKAEQQAVALVFVSAYCPTSNTFMKDINRIVAAFSGKVGFYLVHSDAAAKEEDVRQHQEMFEVKATVLIDRAQTLARRLGASVTPEVVVLGKDGKVAYQGRVNDLYLGPTKRQRKATTRDLEDALEALLAARPVQVPKTEAVGCKIQ